MKKGLIVGLLTSLGLLTALGVVNLTETPKQEVGYFDDVVTAKGPVVNVLAYGVTGDGVTDDSPAIRAAITAALAAGQNHTAGIQTTTHAAVYFPKGIYICNSALSVDSSNTLQYLEIRGDNAILVAGSGVTLFGGVGTQTNFSGLQFHGGATAISIKTANLDASKISIEKCYFLDQTGFAIKADTGSYSTLCVIQNNEFVGYQAGGGVLDTGGMDQTVFVDNWVEMQSDLPIRARGARVYMSGNIFVPLAAIDTCWIQIEGSLWAKDCTFGGENSVASIFDVRVASATFQVQDCACYAPGGKFVRFYELPKQLVWDRVVCNGDFTNTLWVDTALTASKIDTWRTLRDKYTSLDSGYLKLTGHTGAVAMLAAEAKRSGDVQKDGDAIPLTALAVSRSGGMIWDSYAGDFGTVALAPDEFGNSVYQFTADADGQSAVLGYNTLLNGLSVGSWYTVLLPVSINTDDTFVVQVTASDTVHRQQIVGKGMHLISMPFVMATAESVMIAYEHIASGVVVYHVAFYVVAGRRQSHSYPLTWYSTAAPATLAHIIGEEVTNSDPDAGDPLGWLCTAGGTPGTWMEAGYVGSASVKNGSTSAGYVDFYEDSDNGTNYIRLQPGSAIGANRIVDLVTSNFVQTVIKTINLDDDASTDDYQFDDDAANVTEQVITLTNILPAYAELTGWQIRCFEGMSDANTATVQFGTSSGGTELANEATACDDTNEIICTAAGAGPILAATNAARSLYFSVTPSSNWSIMHSTGRWAVMITYVDYAAAYTQKNP